MNGLREAPSGAAPAGVAPAPSGHVVVIGVGNEFRSDDGVGLVIARRIRERVPATVAVVEASGEGAATTAATTYTNSGNENQISARVTRW